MAAPTIQPVARAILRDWGILYLDPATPAGQTNLCRLIDVEAVALVLTQAFQEIATESGSESQTQPGSAVLNAPTAVTLTVTDGSTTISALTTYAAWQLGCTIRVTGDDQDNELISSTKLARPYLGTGGATTGTIYGDAVTLDETVSKIIAPMLLKDGQPVGEATSRHEFITRGGFPLPNFYHEGFANYPLWNLAQKPLEARPTHFFIDGYYSPTLDYITRRIRFSPMPDTRQTVGWTSTINPIRVAVTDIAANWSGGTYTDPGTKIPCVNGWIESIFLPIARQLGAAQPQFKNESIRRGIEQQYLKALARLKGADGSVSRATTRYL